MAEGTRIYLVRHGETDWNRQLRLQGREDIPLNETGRLQAKTVAKALATLPVDQVVSSPLSRAVETAEIIAKGRNLSVVIENDLTERDFGRLSGTRPEERRQLTESGKYIRMEKPEQLTRRLMRVLYRYSRSPKLRHVVMVSHGSAINSVLAVLSGRKIGSGKTRLKNGSVSVLERQSDDLKLLAVNLSMGEFSAWLEHSANQQ